MLHSRRYSAHLHQGGLEIPAKLTLTATSREESMKAKKLIEGTLCINVIRDVTASEELLKGLSQGRGICSASPTISKPVSTSETKEVINVSDH